MSYVDAGRLRSHSRPIALRKSNKKTTGFTDRLVLADKVGCAGGTVAERVQWTAKRGGVWEIARSDGRSRLCEFPG